MNIFYAPRERRGSRHPPVRHDGKGSHWGSTQRVTLEKRTDFARPCALERVEHNLRAAVSMARCRVWLRTRRCGVQWCRAHARLKTCIFAIMLCRT